MLHLTLTIEDPALVQSVFAVLSKGAPATLPAPTPTAINTANTAEGDASAPAKRTRASRTETPASAPAAVEAPAPTPVQPEVVQPTVVQPEVVAAPAAESKAPEGKTYTLESMMPIAISVMAKDRAGLSALLTEFGAKNIKSLDASKYAEFGPKLEALNK